MGTRFLILWRYNPLYLTLKVNRECKDRVGATGRSPLLCQLPRRIYQTMQYNSAIHHRRSIRLRGYDYAQAGAYFVTAVAQGRECLFGEVVDGQMILNEWGQVVHEEWERSSNIRRE